MEIAKTLKRVAAVAAFGVMGMMGSDGAQAETATSTLSVQMQVNKVCTVDPSGALNFGLYNDFAGNTATASIAWNCSAGTAVSFALDNGLNYSSGYRMANTNATPTSPPAGTVFAPYAISIASGTQVAGTPAVPDNPATPLVDESAPAVNPSASGSLVITASVAAGLAGTLQNDTYEDTVIMTATY